MSLPLSTVKSFAKSRLSPTQIAVLRNGLHNVRSSIRRARGIKGPGSHLTYLKGGYQDIFPMHVVHSANFFYGIEPMLLEYSDRREPLKGVIEHGLYVGPFVNRDETYLSRLPVVMTFGPRRAAAIRDICDVPILQLGPYIQYASPIISANEMVALKEQLGKVLLVFPSHSIETVDVAFDVRRLIEQSEELAWRRGIQNVLYCLYFNDVNNGLAQIFDDFGCTVVSAGHRSDPLFLSRLRSYIELSDVTASNSVGTHMGYCVALGRPHILLDVEVEKEVESDLEYDYADRERYVESVKREELLIASAFGDRAAPDVLNGICEKYWGLGISRSPEELRHCFAGFDEAYRCMRRHGMTARESMRAVAPDVLSLLDVES